MAARRQYLGILFALGAVFSLGAGFYLSNAPGAAAPVGEPQRERRRAVAAGDLAIPVEVAEVVRDTLIVTITAAGQAKPVRQTTIVATVSGRIERLLVRENDLVTPETLLLTIDSTEYALEVDRALAARRAAEASYREATIFDGQIQNDTLRSERDAFVRARTGLDDAELRLRKALLDLEHTRITPPFAGRVASIQIAAGQWVRSGDLLLSIVDLNTIEVEVHVLEGEVGFLAPGRSARVNFTAFPDEVFYGRVETINPLIDPVARTAKVTVRLDNPDGRILPGMYARVTLDARRFPDRILVPRAAILERDRRTIVFVNENGFAKWRYVTTGLENNDFVEILPGPRTQTVEPGEQVLVRGHFSLIHDAAIRVSHDVRDDGPGIAP